MKASGLVERVIFLGILVGIFLPIRLLFSTYVSDHWLGSFGFVTIFAVLLMFLIKKGKLGWFGRLFEKQLHKIMIGKSGKYLVVVCIVFLLYFGTASILIDRGNTIYSEDKKQFYLAILGNGLSNMHDINIDTLNGPQPFLNNNFVLFANLEYAFSISYSIINEMTDEWLNHFHVVFMAEQVEILGLFILYRVQMEKLKQLKAK